MTSFHEKNWRKKQNCAKYSIKISSSKNIEDINNEIFLDSRIKILVKSKRLQET